MVDVKDQTFTRTRSLLQRGIEERLHIGAQVYVSCNGEALADLAVGEARPGVAMTPDSLVLWRSAGKPVTAILIAQLHERGRLDIDDPVAKHLPEFAQHGKDSITIRHVLTHTGGFRAASFKENRDAWDRAIAAISSARPEPRWTPGERAGYHVHTGWYILGEVVRRVTQEPFLPYLRRVLFEPLGMDDCWIGMAEGAYDAYGDRIALTPMCHDGRVSMPDWLNKAWITSSRPSANLFGPARQVARFYEMLLGGGELDGVRVIESRTVDLFTRRHRVGLIDHTFNFPLDWGLGFCINSRRHAPDRPQDVPYGYGAHASDDTFGHAGRESSIAFADPVNRLAVAVMCNGTPGEPAHQKRMHELLTALYEDLGVAG